MRDQYSPEYLKQNPDYQLATCESKIRMTAVVAKRAARRKKGRHAYRCPICKQWHVGNNQ